jgi:hypothetical protein
MHRIMYGEPNFLDNVARIGLLQSSAAAIP